MSPQCTGAHIFDRSTCHITIRVPRKTVSVSELLKELKEQNQDQRTWKRIPVLNN